MDTLMADNFNRILGLRIKMVEEDGEALARLKQRAHSRRQGDRLTAQGYLETDGHRKAAERMVWHCSDSPQGQAVSGDLSSTSDWNSTSSQVEKGVHWELRR